MKFQMIKRFSLIDDQDNLVDTIPFEDNDGHIHDYEMAAAVKYGQTLFVLLNKQDDSSNFIVAMQTPAGLALANKEDTIAVSKYFSDNMKGDL